MARLTRARRQRLERLEAWYTKEYLPWFHTYGGDFGDFEIWKEHHLDTWRWPLKRSRALWPPRRQP